MEAKMKKLLFAVGILLIVINLSMPLTLQAGNEKSPVKTVQTTEVNKKLKQWTSGTPSERLEALLWLKDNVLKKGMKKEEIKKLLGSPSWIGHDGAWGYRVGKVGIWVGFERDKIKSVTKFEQ